MSDILLTLQIYMMRLVQIFSSYDLALRRRTDIEVVRSDPASVLHSPPDGRLLMVYETANGLF